MARQHVPYINKYLVIPDSPAVFNPYYLAALCVESSLTISIPKELVEVPHESFIVQPSWLFRCSYQLMLKHMFSFMKFLFCYNFSLSHALYASLLFQI